MSDKKPIADELREVATGWKRGECIYYPQLIELADRLAAALAEQKAEITKLNESLDSITASAIRQSAEIERLEEINARMILNGIRRICTDCGEDMGGPEHKDCHKCDVERFKAAICIYAREEMGHICFESDEEVIKYFMAGLHDR